MSETRHIVFGVPDISCAHCKLAIERAVGAVEGVESVEVDVADKSVDVRFDPARTSPTSVAAAIVGAGYEVSGEH
jgi:copper chaperone